MKPRNRLSVLSIGVLGTTSLGLFTGCDAEEIQAVVAGVELVADVLVDLDDDSRDDISFGDWLLDEIR